MARPRQHIVTFTEEEVTALKRQLRSVKTNKTIRGRIQILLLLDSAHNDITLPYETIAKKSGTSLSSVRKVVKDYSAGGLDLVLKIRRHPNSDTARLKADGRREAEIIRIACGPAPEGRSRWTLRLLADRCRVELDEPLSKDTIRRALKKTGFTLTGTPTGASLPKDQETS